MANAFFYSNTAQQTTLSGSISSGATSITVAATTGFPGSFPYVLAVDYGAATEELVSVSAAAGTTLTVSRGFSGTSAQSHSLGAVVRHVWHAGDASDFRTHEAATAAVHGVTGALVGTTDTQTLTNKTLSAPAVNSGVYASGGSFAGTYTGAPTFSGAVVLSGTPSISNGAALAGTFSGTPTFSGNVTHSGEIILTNLLRGSRALAADSMYESRVTADSVARFFTQTDGKHWWGPGNAAVDTNLYRSGANALTTDDALNVGGILTASAAVSVGGVLTAVNASLDNITAFGITHTSGIGYKPSQNGVASISFAAATSNSTAVAFPIAFGSTPRVFCNINSGAGTTASWSPRAIAVSTTGFTIFVQGPSAAWSGVEVQWAAFAQ